jgi:hypothetical protein
MGFAHAAERSQVLSWHDAISGQPPTPQQAINSVGQVFNIAIGARQQESKCLLAHSYL